VARILILFKPGYFTMSKRSIFHQFLRTSVGIISSTTIIFLWMISISCLHYENSNKGFINKKIDEKNIFTGSDFYNQHQRFKCM
jgi:hypothetical protein